MMNQGATMGNCAGCLTRKPRNHHKQPSQDAKQSVNQPNSNSSMSSSTRDKNCTGNNVSIAGNDFSGNTAEKIATVEPDNSVYPSQGPNEEKRHESSGEADTQSSSDDNCTGAAKLPENGSKPKKGKNGNNVSVAGNSLSGNTFSDIIAEKLACIEVHNNVHPSQSPKECHAGCNKQSKECKMS